MKPNSCLLYTSAAELIGTHDYKAFSSIKRGKKSTVRTIEAVSYTHLQQKAVRFGFEQGARIGLGSDSGAYLVPHGQGLMDEYAFMKEAVGRENAEALDRRLAESEAWIRENMKRG